MGNRLPARHVRDWATAAAAAAAAAAATAHNTPHRSTRDPRCACAAFWLAHMCTCTSPRAALFCAVATVAVKTFVPPMIKWMQPRVGSAQGVAGAIEPEGFSDAACCTYGRTLIIFGGYSEPVRPGSDAIPFHSCLFTLHIEKMRWERLDPPKVSGNPPSPRGGCAACLNGNRFLIYGGEVGGDKEPPKADCAPSDEFFSLDLEQTTWTNCQIRGVSPGCLSFGAAACVGNKVFFFGGWNGPC